MGPDMGPDIGDIGHPGLIRRHHIEPLLQPIGRDHGRLAIAAFGNGRVVYPLGMLILRSETDDQVHMENSPDSDEGHGHE